MSLRGPSSLRTVLLFALTVAPASAQSLNGFLARLDETAPKFSAATADLTWLDHQAVIEAIGYGGH
jgi:hypothetical protein